jgi:hypothetical protein
MLKEQPVRGALMTLNETLQQIKLASRSRIPAEAATTMARATEKLKGSGIIKMALGPGKPAPGFALPDWQGNVYKSTELLTKGPLILHFYRGSW